MLWCSDFCKWVRSSGLFLFIKASFWGISRDLAYFAHASSDCYFKLPSTKREADIIRRINNSEWASVSRSERIRVYLNERESEFKTSLPPTSSSILVPLSHVSELQVCRWQISGRSNFLHRWDRVQDWGGTTGGNWCRDSILCIKVKWKVIQVHLPVLPCIRRPAVADPLLIHSAVLLTISVSLPVFLKVICGPESVSSSSIMSWFSIYLFLTFPKQYLLIPLASSVIFF